MSDTSTATETGATQDGGQEQTDTSEQTQGTDTGRAGSEDSLKADLANERKARQAAAKQAADLQKRLEKLEEATQSETEKAINKARAEGANEALAKANLKIAKMAIRSAATEKLADPSDADVIDASSFAVDDDGNVDMKAINAELDALVKAKPHWAKQQKQTAGSVDQGARGNAARPTDMNSWLRKELGH